MNICEINEAELENKRVFCRVDFNVPIENGKVTDNTRIVRSLETIQYLLKQKSKVILCSHLGRPKGSFKEEYSLKPVFDELSKHIDTPLYFSKEITGASTQKQIDDMKAGELLLLENIRFEAGEEKNDEFLSKKLADLSDIFVNDAFGTAHRAHSSTVGVAQLLPSYAGFLMQSEIETLSSLFQKPELPFLAIIGGSKVSSKIGILSNLVKKVSSILIGGGMSYTFLSSKAIEIGQSIYEREYTTPAFQLLQKAALENTHIHLPVDHLIAEEVSKNAKTKNTSSILKDWYGVDIGTKTISAFKKEIAKAKTILWNGPMGVFEIDEFSNGTFEIAKAIANSNATSVVGGGDSIAAINKLGIKDKFTHISTGGGASLEFLEGKKMPGIEVLVNN